jgi:aryl-alcohol dehydrogenase-like predicted oxidoreductase
MASTETSCSRPNSVISPNHRVSISREALITQFEENLRLLRRNHVDTLQLHEADMHHWWSDEAASSDRILSERDYFFDDAPALAVLRELKASGPLPLHRPQRQLR